MSGIVKRAYKVVGLGEFGSNSHPVHPATVHFPIAFLILANTLNLLYGTSLYLSAPFTADDTNLSTLAIVGYASNLLGIITSVPAFLTGALELYAMISTHGLYQIDQRSGEKRLIPKVKIALIHAGLNDIAIGLAVYNWLKERNSPEPKPQDHQVLLSALALVGALYAAYLGGVLVYTHGVGVQRMGKGAEEKKAMIDKAKKKE